MKFPARLLTFTVIGIVLALGAAACGGTNADTASRNLSVAAEQFEVDRRIIFYNGITEEVMLLIEGKCSIEAGMTAVSNALEVTCKTGPDQFVKHFLGLSDNVTFFVEQLEPIGVDVYRQRVIFKPESIVPDIDLVTTANDDG